MNNNEIYVIGDVHGCYKTLCALIEQLPNKYESKICFVGDLIDRGPNSKDVVELIKKHNYDCVLGNHEQMCIDYKGNPFNMVGGYGQGYTNQFGGNGGVKTLESYANIEFLKNDIKDFMKNLPIYKVYNILNKDNKKLIVSHSAIGNYIDDNLNYLIESYETLIDVEQNIIWNREVIADMGERNIIPNMKNYYNVFGHSIFDKPIINNKYAAIDTGVHSYEYGNLTCLSYPSMKIYTQRNIDR